MNTSENVLRGPISPFRSRPLVACCLLLVFACDESKAQPPGAGDSNSVRGKIERFTTAPLGETDGAVLDDGTWLHWPPHMPGLYCGVLRVCGCGPCRSGAVHRADARNTPQAGGQ
jgi:hypothetical protein